VSFNRHSVVIIGKEQFSPMTINDTMTIK